MKFTDLDVKDFMRISHVQITPSSLLVRITGPNGAGKTSILNAIETLLREKDYHPDMPVRKGRKAAKISGVICGDDGKPLYRVSRRITAKTNQLTIDSVDGARYLSPQKILNELVGDLTFDPLAFGRLKPAAQAALINEMTGCDTSALDAEIKFAYDRRTVVGREIKSLDARVAAYAIPDDPGEVGEQIDLVSIAEKKSELVRVANENSRLRLAATSARRASDTARDKVAQLRASLKAAEESLAALDATADAAELAAASLVDPDGSDIDRQIEKAREHNRGVLHRERARQVHLTAVGERDLLKKLLAEKREISNAYSAAIETAEGKKADMVKNAKFPVPGMSVVDDQVVINGVPFSQASSAEKLRIGLEMGAACNPKLKIILIRDGSLLDRDGIEFVDRWAKEHDTVVWMESVETETPVGIVIQDGHIRGVDVEEDADEGGEQ